jgi:hypothetical protein
MGVGVDQGRSLVAQQVLEQDLQRVRQPGDTEVRPRRSSRRISSLLSPTRSVDLAPKLSLIVPLLLGNMPFSVTRRTGSTVPPQCVCRVGGI